MLNILQYISQAVGILISLVMLVERQGDGAAKKQEVIDGVQAAVAAIPGIPAPIKAIFMIDAVVGVMIDVLVAVLNKLSIFQKDATADPTPAASAAG